MSIQHRWDVLNGIAGAIRAQRYLEIGVQRGECLHRVHVAEKVGVDPDRSSAATVHMTSDAYFDALPEDFKPFDLVFIDGLHHAEQVVQDVQNALLWTSPYGVIVLHDCDPPDERAARRTPCAGQWCGDVWRAWLQLRTRLGLKMEVVDVDLGCGVIWKGGYWSGNAPPPDLDPMATWSRFREHRRSWLNLVPVAVFEAGLGPPK